MRDSEPQGRATIIPTMRYTDAAAAIKWLCKAFGFREHLIVPGDDGTIAHAQLVLGNGMIMVGTARDDDYGKLISQPGDGGVTQTPYVIVEDVDAHYSQARRAGASIETEPEDQPYGGRLYICRDPEGHLWNFGSYNPWGPAKKPG